MCRLYNPARKSRKHLLLTLTLAGILAAPGAYALSLGGVLGNNGLLGNNGASAGAATATSNNASVSAGNGAAGAHAASATSTAAAFSGNPRATDINANTALDGMISFETNGGPRINTDLDAAAAAEVNASDD